MNLALDGFSSGQSRQLMQNEALAYRERNETVQNQLEKLFLERQAKDAANNGLELEIERERNKLTEMVQEPVTGRPGEVRGSYVTCPNS